MTSKRLLMTACYHGHRLIGRALRLRSDSVQALVITPAGRMVLVCHSYLPGWHFPGGGLRRRESPEVGIIRELREEIGLLRWGGISRLERPPLASGAAAIPLFVFTDSEYRFRPSLEIDRVAEFGFDAPLTRGQRLLLERWRASQRIQEHDVAPL